MSVCCLFAILVFSDIKISNTEYLIIRKYQKTKQLAN